jgi:4-hydroxy-tetrahydrodipicolinate synthase
MIAKKISGVYAAVLSPRLADDSIDTEALTKLIRFLVSKEITTFAINGATGEFCLTTPEHLQVLLSTVAAASDGKARVLCGVGAPGTAGTIALGRVAERNGVDALLLPMPCFFPYQQEDLDIYCREVASAINLPILLYNLPQFTSGLEKETVRTLITEVSNIIGIKDSSGSLDIMRDLTDHDVDACRIVGNDSILAPARLENICDGVVSGVACALPELILELYAQNPQADTERFTASANLVTEFIERLKRFPTPWGLKWILEARGVINATFSQPVTPHRLEQSEALARWLSAWLPNAVSNKLSTEHR